MGKGAGPSECRLIFSNFSDIHHLCVNTLQHVACQKDEWRWKSKMEKKRRRKKRKKEKEKEGVCKQTGQNAALVSSRKERNQRLKTPLRTIVLKEGDFFSSCFGLKKGTTRLRKMSCSVLFAHGFSWEEFQI